MSGENQQFDSILEQAASEIRGESIADEAVEAAAARVWARLSNEAQPAGQIRTCADFQALIPDYRAGRLSAARALLFKDHTHECVACRKALEGSKVIEFPVSRRRPVTARPAFRWAAAAAVVLAAGLGTWNVVERFGATSVRPTVEAVNGALYRVSERGSEPLAVGAELPAGAEIRTAKDSNAVVRLRDNSVVEVGARSAFSVTDGGVDLTVKLARGSVIVQAAKRRAGHLYVTTADCSVAVSGTIFSVSAGLKGSRVSVIEGQVKVTQGGTGKVLQSGGQASTSELLEAVPVREEIGWSRNLAKHLARMRDVAPPGPEPRYSSTLLARLPDTVAVYAAIPNVATYLGGTQAVFRQKMADDPAWREWLKTRGAHAEAILDKLRAASDYLSGEILIVAVTGADGKVLAPVFLAETRRAGLDEFLKRESGGALHLASEGNLAAFSTEPEALRAALAKTGGGFAATPLGQRVAEAYREGAGLLLSVDLERFGGSKDLRYFMAGQRQVGGKTEMRASLGFSGTRPGVVSWLAAPGPIGALDYVSPEATVVSAFAVQTPAKILADTFGKGLGPLPPAAETGVDVAEIAATLGGEFSFAIDGPVFPTPSWKVVAEVYDPARLQAALGKIVETVNGKHAKPLLRAARETVGGRTYFMIGGADENPLTEAHYTFADGYVILAANRTLLNRAIEYRATLYTLARSPEFTALVPRDRHADFSGLLYYNVASTVKQYAGVLGGFLSPPQKKMLDEMGSSKPTLVTAYGEPDGMSFAGSGSLFNVSLANLLTGNVFGGGMPPFGGKGGGTRGPRPAYH